MHRQLESRVGPALRGVLAWFGGWRGGEGDSGHTSHVVLLTWRISAVERVFSEREGIFSNGIIKRFPSFEVFNQVAG